MNVLIVEDETAAATNLKALLLQIDPSIRIEAVIETVVETVRWVKDNPLPDLIFMDIHLADGQAFKIFEQIDIECPIVFTTAYDRYALDAFKVNSIDYILKPIKKEELRRAFDKLRRLSAPQVAEYVEQTNRFVTSRITPVPSGAFLRSTEALPNLPITSWITLALLSSDTVIIFFIASSLPLRIASGISVAFPKPAPTWPLPSPTTTKAVKRKLRPPLTTLVTRLIDTTFSNNSI